MSLGVFAESPIEDNDDHSHFFAHSDDDADTASQRSISLSSNPSSPSKRGFSALDASLATPIKDAFSPRTDLQSDVQFENVALSPTKGVFSPMNDFDTTSIPETGSGSPSVVTSFKFEEDGTRPSSMSSNPSLFHEEESSKNKDESSSSTLKQTSPPPLDRHESEASSVYSAKTGSSSATGGKKARPESKLLETNEAIILGIALVDFNHIVSIYASIYEHLILTYSGDWASGGVL